MKLKLRFWCVANFESPTIKRFWCL